MLVSFDDSTISSGYPGVFAVDAASSTQADTVQFDNVEISYSSRGTSAAACTKNDFDADGKTDLVVYNVQTGEWYILQSSDGLLYSGGAIQFGWAGAIPTYGN